MDQMTHEGHGQAADPHAGHKMSKADGNHDRHAGHSIATFHDKFRLSFVLTIPVVFWLTDVQHWVAYTAPSFSMISFDAVIRHFGQEALRLQLEESEKGDSNTLLALADTTAPDRIEVIHSWLQSYAVF